MNAAENAVKNEIKRTIENFGKNIFEIKTQRTPEELAEARKEIEECKRLAGGGTRLHRLLLSYNFNNF